MFGCLLPPRYNQPVPAPAQPPAPRAKQRRRDAAQVRLAALLTTHPPARTLELAPDPALDIHSRLDFEPVGLAPGAVYGLLRSGYLPRGLAYARLPVKRGRWGAKPPETLALLQPFPAELLELPAVRWRGVVKGMAEALGGVRGPAATGPATTTELWLAAELALQGSLPLAGARKFAAERGEPLPRHGKAGAGEGEAQVLERDGLLLWRGWLRRHAERLAGLLRQPKKRNPLRRTLTPGSAAQLLDFPDRAIAAAVLDELARAFHLARAGADGYALSGELAPAELAAADAAVVSAILARYAADGDAPPLTKLRAAYPSHLHVVAWLLEAERLVELPGGSLVLAARFEPWLRAFPLRRGQSAPTVRAIKDKLGLGRREAEALHAWYLRQGAK
jgi:hypothetical protein